MKEATELFNIRQTEDMLRKMILTPSSNTDDKKAIVGFVTGILKKNGFKCKTVGDTRSPAIIAAIGKNGMLFSGHLDTVPIGDGWKFNQGEMKGSIMHGRGTSDMKGGCVAMLLAATELSKRKTPVTIVFTTDEETTMKGAETVSKEDVVRNAKAIVVCEPTSLSIGSREKGLLQMKLTTRGKSAHAAMPKSGENAIHKFLEITDKLRSLMIVPADPMKEMTLNLDVIRAGAKVNVLPDLCEAEIDVRTPAGMPTLDALRIVKDRILGLDCELNVLNSLEPICTSEKTEIVRIIKLLKKKVKTIDIAYATEMTKYSKKNDNLIAFGPGDPTQAHVIDERIDVREVLEAARVYVSLSRSRWRT